MRRLAVPLLLALALLTPAACSEAKDDPLADDTADDGGAGDDAKDDEKTDQADDEGSDGPTVELVEAGAEPRQELRLRPPEDCSLPVTLRQRQQIGLAFGGIEQDIASTTEQDVTYLCEEVTEDRIAVRLEYGDTRVVEADDTTRDVLEETLAAFEGAEGSIVFDARGRVLDSEAPDVDLDVPAGFGDALAEGLDTQGNQLALPLPEEAVGLGARWRVTADVSVLGIASVQVTTFTLTSLEDGLVTADVVVDTTFAPGSMELPGLPIGDAEIVEGAVHGTGTITWNLDEPLSLGAQTMEGTLTLRIGAEGERTEMTQQQHFELSTTRR